MWLLWHIWLFLAICQIPLTSLSHVGLEDDSEGSGDGQGGSGFDSLDLSVEDDDHPKKTTTNMRDDSKAKIRIVSQDGGEARLFPADSDMILDYTSGNGPDVFFSEEKLKTLLRSKEAVAGAIAGGVMGLILAMAVAAVWIYKRRMEDGSTLEKKN